MSQYNIYNLITLNLWLLILKVNSTWALEVWLKELMVKKNILKVVLLVLNTTSTVQSETEELNTTVKSNILLIMEPDMFTTDLLVTRLAIVWCLDLMYTTEVTLGVMTSSISSLKLTLRTQLVKNLTLLASVVLCINLTSTDLLLTTSTRCLLIKLTRTLTTVINLLNLHQFMKLTLNKEHINRITILLLMLMWPTPLTTLAILVPKLLKFKVIILTIIPFNSLWMMVSINRCHLVTVLNTLNQAKDKEIAMMIVAR